MCTFVPWTVLCTFLSAVFILLAFQFSNPDLCFRRLGVVALVQNIFLQGLLNAVRRKRPEDVRQRDQVGVSLYWELASPAEREELAGVYGEVLKIPRDVENHVQSALLLEILEQHDHRTWPPDYQLSGISWGLQGLVMDMCESFAVDKRQRESYLRLLFASKGRHKDVAYGLSERILWRDKENVVGQLISMGKREYEGRVPTSHVMDNGVLHVAVSYKHMSAHKRIGVYTQGTLSEQQAHAIWTAVRSMRYVDDNTEVRVWLDQNLHRCAFPPGTEWHEYGLLPYACLRTVFIGNGDFSLRGARTRPWLWVELLCALRADGVQCKPGYDFVEGSDGVLVAPEKHEDFKRIIMNYGWFMGLSFHVDDAMASVSRTVSFWRRDSFFEHHDYEYADDFERFVNWARRFTVRGVPYSEMSWNHSSEPVCGMDSIALLRSLPTFSASIERSLATLMPEVSWHTASTPNRWVLGDLFDRSQIGDLPVSALVEVEMNQLDDGEELVIYGKKSALENLRFRRANGKVSLVQWKQDNDSDSRPTRYDMRSRMIVNEYAESAMTITLRAWSSNVLLLTYKPFTLRKNFMISGGLVLGDACMRPARLPPRVEEAIGLRTIGICFNGGICEMVYTVNVDGDSWPVSTMEIRVILAACHFNVEKCRVMTKALKNFCSYKSMRYRDLSKSEVLMRTRGRRVGDIESLTDKMIVSGEVNEDVTTELVRIISTRQENHTLVAIDRVDMERVQILFRGRNYLTRILTTRVAANSEFALVEETDRDQLVNDELTGLLQMAGGMQPTVKVKRHGSGLNPMITTDDNGNALHVNAVSGIFSTCESCGREVCTINGLEAKIYRESESDGVYRVEWLGSHSCIGQTYHNFDFDTGSRIA